MFSGIRTSVWSAGCSMGFGPFLTVLPNICFSSLSFPSTLLLLDLVHPQGFHQSLKERCHIVSICSLGLSLCYSFSMSLLTYIILLNTRLMSFFFSPRLWINLSSWPLIESWGQILFLSWQLATVSWSWSCLISIATCVCYFMPFSALLSQPCFYKPHPW